MADYKNIIPFVRKWEGGLSKSLTDTAHTNPAPCLYKGVGGYHTNKGITWAAFKSSAASLGYSSSDCNLFFEMPDWVWEGIFKKTYWDAYHLDQMKSQLFANAILSWAWGSGLAGAESQLAKFLRTKYGVIDSNIDRLEILNHFNSLIKDEKNVFNQMVEWRKNYFIGLNQPSNINGWLNRLNEFRDYNLSILNSIAVAVKKKAVIIVIIVIAIVISVVVYFRFIKNRL